MSRERKDTAGGKRLARAALLLALCVTAAPNTTSAQSVASRPAPTWRLVEDLRIGDDADGPAQFGEIRGLVSTKAGSIFVLDYKAMELRVFDARGKFVRLAARRAHGPGETEGPNGIAIGNDDVVVQCANCRAARPTMLVKVG